MRLDLTIAIPVRNEEKNLPECLKKIGDNFAQKIIVIDSESTDGTKKIAKDFGAETLDFKWNGRFPKKRNWFLQNHAPTTKWILFLDADEYLTEAFKIEVSKKISLEGYVGFWLNYTIYFMGRRLKGGYPLKKLALFRVGTGFYEKVDEDHWSLLDMEIHEHPVLKGTIGQIKNKIDHHDLRDVPHYISKHNEYAAWEVQRFFQSTNPPVRTSRWLPRQKLKYFLMRNVLIGPIFFVGSFFFLGGFRDGKRGLAFAILKMSYFNQIYCRIQEVKNQLSLKNKII